MVQMHDPALITQHAGARADAGVAIGHETVAVHDVGAGVGAEGAGADWDAELDFVEHEVGNDGAGGAEVHGEDDVGGVGEACCNEAAAEKGFVEGRG